MVGTSRSRIGQAVRSERTARSWPQQRLARSSGVSATAVGVIERGEPGASLDSIEQVMHALGLDLAVTRTGPPVVGRPSSDAAHARCVSAVVRLMRRSGLEVVIEQPVAGQLGAGWVDIMAFDRGRRRLVVIEVKTDLRDLGRLLRQIELYASGCAPAARSLGWRPIQIVVAAVVLASAEADMAALANRAMLAAALPVRGRAAIAAMLDGGPVDGRALLMIDPDRRGRAALGRLTVDGRRTSAPYRDAADLRSRASRPGRRGTARRAPVTR